MTRTPTTSTHIEAAAAVTRAALEAAVIRHEVRRDEALTPGLDAPDISDRIDARMGAIGQAFARYAEAMGAALAERGEIPDGAMTRTTRAREGRYRVAVDQALEHLRQALRDEIGTAADTVLGTLVYVPATPIVYVARPTDTTTEPPATPEPTRPGRLARAIAWLTRRGTAR